MYSPLILINFRPFSVKSRPIGPLHNLKSSNLIERNNSEMNYSKPVNCSFSFSTIDLQKFEFFDNNFLNIRISTNANAHGCITRNNLNDFLLFLFSMRNLATLPNRHPFLSFKEIQFFNYCHNPVGIVS